MQNGNLYALLEEDKMKKHHLLTDILNLITVCLIAYINFSTDFTSWIFSIISSVVVTVIFCSTTFGKSTTYLVASILVSFASYYFSTNVHDTNSILNTLISIFDLYCPTYVLYLCLKSEKLGLGKVLYFTTAASIATNLLTLAKIKYFDKVSLIDVINEAYDQVSNTYLTVFSSNKSFEGFNPEQLLSAVDTVRDITVMLLPAFVIIACMVISYILMVAVRGMTKIYLGNKYPNVEYFYQATCGKMLSVITIVLVLISFAFGNEYFSSAVYNFAIVACFIYFSVGVSVAYFFIIKKLRNIHLAKICTALLVIASVISVLIMPTFNGLSILFMIGLMDSNVNFRKLKKVGV